MNFSHASSAQRVPGCQPDEPHAGSAAEASIALAICPETSRATLRQKGTEPPARLEKGQQGEAGEMGTGCSPGRRAGELQVPPSTAPGPQRQEEGVLHLPGDAFPVPGMVKLPLSKAAAPAASAPPELQEGPHSHGEKGHCGLGSDRATRPVTLLKLPPTTGVKEIKEKINK